MLTAWRTTAPAAGLREDITKKVWCNECVGESYTFTPESAYIFKYKDNRLEGAWRMGPDICKSSVDKGNLITYLRNSHCCYNAQITGNFLLMTLVGSLSGICESNTLKGKEP